MINLVQIAIENLYSTHFLLQVKRFWIISIRMPARFTAVPKEKSGKAEARRATQYKTRQGARREFNSKNDYEPPAPSESLIRYQAYPKNPCPDPSFAGI